MVPKIAGTKAPFIETQFEVSLGLSVFDVVRVFLHSLNGSSWFKLRIKVTFEMKPGVERGGSTQFYTWRICGANSYPFIYHF